LISSRIIVALLSSSSVQGVPRKTRRRSLARRLAGAMLVPKLPMSKAKTFGGVEST